MKGVIIYRTSILWGDFGDVEAYSVGLLYEPHAPVLPD